MRGTKIFILCGRVSLVYAACKKKLTVYDCREKDFVQLCRDLEITLMHLKMKMDSLSARSPGKNGWPQKIDWHLCLLVSIPLLLLLVNVNWFIERTGPTNDWHYFSYFLDYANNPFAVHVDYRSARVLWFIQGWLFNKLSSPMVAFYSLSLLIFYTCIISLYYITRLLFNKNVGLLTAASFAVLS